MLGTSIARHELRRHGCLGDRTLAEVANAYGSQERAGESISPPYKGLNVCIFLSPGQQLVLVFFFLFHIVSLLWLHTYELIQVQLLGAVVLLLLLSVAT